MGPNRGLYEDPAFREEARALVPDPYLLDDLLETVRFTLTHGAESGRHLGNGIYWIVADPLPNGKTVAVVYSFDEGISYPQLRAKGRCTVAA